jgi:hypothetical protein
MRRNATTIMFFITAVALLRTIVESAEVLGTASALVVTPVLPIAAPDGTISLGDELLLLGAIYGAVKSNKFTEIDVLVLSRGQKITPSV